VSGENAGREYAGVDLRYTVLASYSSSMPTLASDVGELCTVDSIINGEKKRANEVARTDL